MAQRAKPWFRLYSEVLNDPKLRRVARHEQIPYATVLGVWTTVLCLANESPQRGTLMIAGDVPVVLDDIAEITGLERNAIETLLKSFQRFKMISCNDDMAVEHWEERQFVRNDDYSTDRVRKFRREEHERNADETQVKRRKRVIDTESDTDTYTEEGGITSPPQKAATPPAMPIRSRKTKREPKPKEPVPPAVQVYHENLKRYPRKSQYELIDKTVDKNLTFWAKVVQAWDARGYNLENVEGMLDWFTSGTIPSRNGAERASPPPEDTSQYRPVDVTPDNPFGVRR